MVPLFNALGISTERIVINPTAPEFFQATKKIHNLLQGAEGTLTEHELEVYHDNIRMVAEAMSQDSVSADIWFLHDPQLLPLAGLLRHNGSANAKAWFWICHIDLTHPNENALESLLPLHYDYDHLIFSLEEYVPRHMLNGTPVSIAPPAIDPLTGKNQPLRESEAWDIVSAMGIDRARPLITQVSRFDLWKDPWGVIDAYRMARHSIPGLQLALLGLSQAADDPEALEVVNSVASHAAGDPDIHLYHDPSGLPASIDGMVNAFQVASSVLMQKSTREGFGLTVTEGMWKGKPMIGGDAGGIRLQIEDGVSGYLVSSPKECADRIVSLMTDDALAGNIGTAAHDSVMRSFLLPRLALDYLKVAKEHAS
ncbi:Trehalose synthase [Geodia barretti]|uniref:Trehalose synthase n=1 Tax=Geodia barretti TaxID=519541 RepID=A0AA35RPZ5_GEOBA|nr:Trehalose synthase [Geodia barretti]